MQYSFLISILLIYLILKNEKFNKIKQFIYKLFWIDVFTNNEKYKYKFGYDFLSFIARFFMYIYIVFMSYSISTSLIHLDIELIISTLILGIIYPIMYRIIIGLQRMFLGINKN
jgi:hypothetical protein